MNAVKSWAIKNLKGDPFIWLVAFLLSLLSILVVYSTTGSLAYKMMGGNTEYYLIKHALLMVLSLLAIWFAHRIDYRYYGWVSRRILVLCIPLLIFTWLFGTNINEASRWLTIPVIQLVFQPSDIAKLALIITLADILAKRQHSIDDFRKTLLPILVSIGIICGLIALTDYSTSILLFLISLLILFIGRVAIKYLVMFTLICVIFFGVSYEVGERGKTFVSRVNDFVENETPYQAQQAYVAIASGGIVGKGPGQSDQRNFLPQSYSDFVYAIIIEEYGIVGGIIVLVLYFVLFYRGMKNAENSDNVYCMLLSVGLSMALLIQALLNMSVAVGILPVTGSTLPFISMGGTSQLFAGIALGIIISISRGEIDDAETIRNEYKKKVE